MSKNNPNYKEYIAMRRKALNDEISMETWRAYCTKLLNVEMIQQADVFKRLAIR